VGGEGDVGRVGSFIRKPYDLESVLEKKKRPRDFDEPEKEPQDGARISGE